MGAKKSLRGLTRRKATKPPKARILIVCEGEKTEVIYFNIISQWLNTSSLKIEVRGKECGTDPNSVVEYGRNRMNEDSGIDKCYCVIDRDSHAVDNFNRAKQNSEKENIRLGKKRDFHLIVSYPCIEYWFILHFVESASPILREGDKSPGDCAVRRLKNFLPHYSKGDEVNMKKLIPNTELAIVRSERMLRNARQTGELNPSSEVHIIIQALQKLASDT